MARRLWVYGSIFVAAVVWAITARVAVLTALASLAAGVLLWTLIEYGMHRFAFHGFAPHWQHHAEPLDEKWILAPFPLSLSVSAALWIAFRVVTGSGPVASLMIGGIVVGYLAYEWVHLRIHSPEAGGVVLRTLRKHHYYHHFASDRVCYGVTSPLWDIVFRSVPQEDRAPASQRI